MPRKLVVCLVLVAVVFALVIAVQPPDFVAARVEQHHLGRTIFWGGLLLTLPWPDMHLRRAATALAITTALASFADAVTAYDHPQDPWVVVRLLRGLLGLMTSLLVLWTLRQTDVLLWSTGQAGARAEDP